MKKYICTFLMMLMAVFSFARSYTLLEFFDYIQAHNVGLINAALKSHPEYLNKVLDGSYSLNVAAESGYNDLIIDFIKRGAKVNLPGANPPMIGAAMHMRLDTVKLLYDKKADINAKEINSGMTALMAVCQFSGDAQEAIVRFLVSKKDLKIDQPDNSNKNALDHAFNGKRFNIAEILLKANAKPSETLAANPEFRTFYQSVMNKELSEQLLNSLDKTLKDELAMN